MRCCWSLLQVSEENKRYPQHVNSAISEGLLLNLHWFVDLDEDEEEEEETEEEEEQDEAAEEAARQQKQRMKEHIEWLHKQADRYTGVPLL